jgi:ABC-type nickel/cobalt efflux system permease component RcnA
MAMSIIATPTTGEWIVAVGSGLLLLLTAAPFLWLTSRFLQTSDGEVARAIAESNEQSPRQRRRKGHAHDHDHASR